jgi:bifunctional non-homologous end joining protein LigD
MTHATCTPTPLLESLGLMEPSRGTVPFTSAAWVFALPTPGLRMLAEFGEGGARLRSRHGVDSARWFPEVGQALAALRMARTVVDGEICVLDAAGRSDLLLLHARALHPGHLPGTSPVVMCLRDVLVWQGQDVRGLPWRERQRRLERLPLHGHAALKLERTMHAEGTWLCRQARALGREAVHAHRADAPYVAGPSIAWLSIPVDTPVQDLAA